MGDTVLGMNLSHGGHLTHGHQSILVVNFIILLNMVWTKKNELINYDEVRRLAIEHQPKLIVAGASAYSRTIDFKKFKRNC